MKRWGGLLVLGVALAACAGSGAPPSTLPPLAGLCDVRPVRDSSGRVGQDGNIRDVLFMRGDAGSCTFRITQDGLNSSAVVLQKPLNGTASVTMDSTTAVIDYAPQAGYRGADSFVVRVLRPDNYRPKPQVQVMDVFVDVQVSG